MFRAQQFAEATGVTVRTLHHYDRIGLLKPKRRTVSGYRLYEAIDVERLEQITALKHLGIPLKKIGVLLDGSPAQFADSLRVQHQLLREKRIMLDRAIRAMGEAELQMGSTADKTALLKNIIEVLAMDSNEDWLAKYSSEAGRAKMEARRQQWSPELQERVSGQWNELIADVERALQESPASAAAQKLTARWNALVEEFTGRDKDVEGSVANAWADRANWPTHMDKKAPVISHAVWDFIAQAKAASDYASS